MILTITMNPSIDIAYHLEKLSLDTVNRVSEVLKTAGGKGLNVTRVLSELGDKVKASGCIGGTNGEYLVNNLPKEVENRFFKISGETRNCIAILHEGSQTEILEKGPTLTREEGENYLKYFESILNDVDVVAISGSLPAGLEENYYEKLISIANKYNKKTVLDCSGAALKSVLSSNEKPTVIKPNKEELSQLLGIEVSDDFNQLKEILNNDIFLGIDYIIVSLGSKGAFAKYNNKYYKVNIPKIEVVNPVGSGDSTVAGISSALAKNENIENILKKANTLGMLNAQEKITGYVNMANYNNIYEKIVVEEV